MGKRLFFLLTIFLISLPLSFIVMTISTDPALSLQTINAKKIFQENNADDKFVSTPSLSFSQASMSAIPGEPQSIAVIIDASQEIKPKLYWRSLLL